MCRILPQEIVGKKIKIQGICLLKSKDYDLVKMYLKHSIQIVTNFSGICNRYSFHTRKKQTKNQNCNIFFSESSENHTLFNEISNAPSR